MQCSGIREHQNQECPDSASSLQATRYSLGGVKRSYKNKLLSYIIVTTIMPVNITCDPVKRAKTLGDRGLDFMDAEHVFADRHFTVTDDRKDYGEIRQITVGFLQGRMLVVGWVQRGDSRHVFTMRKANEREIHKYRQRFEQG